MVSHVYIEYCQRYMFFTVNNFIDVLDIDIVNCIKNFISLTRSKVFTIPTADYINENYYLSNDTRTININYKGITFTDVVSYDVINVLPIGKMKGIEILYNLNNKINNIIWYFEHSINHGLVPFSICQLNNIILSDDQDLTSRRWENNSNYRIRNFDELEIYDRNMIFVAL